MKSHRVVKPEVLDDDPATPGWENRARRAPIFQSPLEPEEFSVFQLLLNRSVERFVNDQSRAYILTMTESANTWAPANELPSYQVADLERRVLQLERDFHVFKQSKPGNQGIASQETIDEIVMVIGRLQQSYIIEETGRVIKHFLGRPQFVELLMSSVDQIEELFGSRPALKCDSEGNLILEMPTTLSTDAAEPNYSKFLRDWWLPRKRGIDAEITLTLEYEPG